MEIKASLKYLNIAPRKARLVVNLIKGMDIERAITELRFSSKRSSGPLLKLLKSAISNAKNNFHIDEEERLYIKSAKVDQGPMLKRMLPRAMGRANIVQKKMSHISLVLGVKEGKVVRKRKRKFELFKKPTEEQIQKEKTKKSFDVGEAEAIKEEAVKGKDKQYRAAQKLHKEVKKGNMEKLKNFGRRALFRRKAI